MSAMTVTDGAAAMRPPIPRRELARRLKHVAPVGREYGRAKRPPALFPVGEILKAHAAWVREQEARLSKDQAVCHHSALEECACDER